MAIGIQLLDQRLMVQTLARARSSPRLRTNHNFHSAPSDNPHRFLNALVRGTYCRPHRHRDPPKSESFLVLRGLVDVFVFDDDGRVTHRHRLGDAGLVGVDLPPGVWHAIVPITDEAVCYEVKPGPYDPATDKDFAPWAPAEGDPSSAAYLAGLLSAG